MKYCILDILEPDCFIEMADAIAKDPDEVILIEVHSGGGIVDEAVYLVSVIEQVKAYGKTVVTYCPAKALSAGIYIFLAGSIVIASPFSHFMHHEISLHPMPLLNWFHLKTSKNMIKNANKVCNNIIDLSILEEDVKKIPWWQSKDLYYTAEELKEKLKGKVEINIGFLPEELTELEIWGLQPEQEIDLSSLMGGEDDE